MRGRKPDATAIRRGDDALMRASVIDGGVVKPETVSSNAALSEMWDCCIGTGLAFEPQDAPLLEQFVFDMVQVAECRRHMFDEDGNPRPVSIAEDELGNIAVRANPYQKPMHEFMREALKLSDELGLSRFARTRLGLAQAAGKAVTLSIAEQIDKAIARRA